MARILGVGIATLDIINVVDGYPGEDAEVRALAQEVRRGGNATNTLVVLSQLGHRCAWAGTLVDEPDGQRIIDDLNAYQIDTSVCRVVPHGKVPTSYIVRNRNNGSRTIVHYRDLPELGFEDFAGIELGEFDWLHFEGRNVAETVLMMERARSEVPHVPRSLEVEKPRPGIDALFGWADIVLFSRAFASARGFTDGPGFLEAMRAGDLHGMDLVCGWGADGAYGLDREGVAHASPAFPPARVVDTLAAGDTFNAGIIDACLRGYDLGEALVAACRVAGRKVGQEGLEGLSHTPRS